MLIEVQNNAVEISDELYRFLESDRKRQAAQNRSDRRHLSKSSFEKMTYNREYSSREFEDMIFHRINLQKLRDAVRCLSADEQKLIYLLYYQQMSMQDIGKAFGISKMAVSKRHQKILNKLRATEFLR